jgi:hypothetical protein
MENDKIIDAKIKIVDYKNSKDEIYQKIHIYLVSKNGQLLPFTSFYMNEMYQETLQFIKEN